MNVFKPQPPFTGIKQTDLAQAWQQNRETLNHISALFHVIIGGANSVAQTVMLDTINLLSKTNQYKGKARHNARLAVKRYNNFDRAEMNHHRKPFQPLQFTEAQMEYLKSSYSTTRNIDLAKTLGISLSKLNKLAKELNLTKQN